MALTLREVEQQMAEHGIFLPPGHDLLVNNGAKFERFKPADSRWKRSKEVWYVLFEHHTQSGKLYYAGKYGIADEQYLVEMSRNNSFTAEEKRKSRKNGKKTARKSRLCWPISARPVKTKPSNCGTWQQTASRPPFPTLSKKVSDPSVLAS